MTQDLFENSEFRIFEYETGMVVERKSDGALQFFNAEDESYILLKETILSLISTIKEYE